MSLDAPTPGISRRSIVKGAAWTVPVVAIAVAAPAASASGSKATLGFVYCQGRNTFRNLVRGGVYLDLQGQATDIPVTNIVLTFVFDPSTFAANLWYIDGDGWTSSVDLAGGTATAIWVGAGLVPYAKPPGVGFGFTVADGDVVPTSYDVTVSSSQANSATTTVTILPVGAPQ